MKKTILLVFIASLIFSCSNRNEYSAEEYKQKQIEYEKKKAELTTSKSSFFKDNKEKLIQLAETIKSLEDTATVMDDLPNDSTFFKSDEVMNMINRQLFTTILSSSLRQHSNKLKLPKVNAIFLQRKYKEKQKLNIDNPLDKLIAYVDSKQDFSKINMSIKMLKEALELKYAFIVEEFICINPKLKNKTEFESGLFLGRVICYDLIKKSPLQSFSFAAQNSEQLQIMKGMEQMKIESDFKSNIHEELAKACNKHFIFN